MLYKKLRGFTLVEVMVVVTIIALLVILSILATAQVRLKSRDAKRISNVNQIVSALESYYAFNKSYPTMIFPGQPISSAGKIFLNAVPVNISPRTDGGCVDQDFKYVTTTTGYKLTFCLGDKVGRLAKGVNYCKNGNCGVPDTVCGQPVTDQEGYSYPTVKIGNQCWMTQHLRTALKRDGTCINGGGTPPCPNGYEGSPRDCTTVPIPGARGVESDCQYRGALYTWDAAMNGDTQESAQGICPDGWHIPSDNEFYTLESTVANPPVNTTTCNPNRQDDYSCTMAAWNLSLNYTPPPAGSPSGFDALRIGGRYPITQGQPINIFSHLTQGDDIWSSTSVASDPTSAWVRIILRNNVSPYDGVGRWRRTKNFAFTVRCLKDAP